MTTRSIPLLPRRQTGLALIMVLLALALVVSLAAGIAQQQNLRVFKAGHYLGQSQGQSVALGAEALARQILFRDFEDDREKDLMVDSPDEVWAQYSAILPIDNDGVVEVQINDLGGRINLNDLVLASGEVNEVTRARVTRLLEILDIREVHPDALIDWIDRDEQTISAYGAEDGQYLLMEPPYRAANQPMASITELRLLEGMTEEYYQRLLPHVVVVPVFGMPINVNMASMEVLQSLHPELTQAQAEAIVSRRDEDRFEDMQAFLALPEFAGMGLKADGLALRTFFFDVASRITFDNRVYHLVSRIYRSPDGEFSVLHRDAGQRNVITKQPFAVTEG